MGHLFEKRKICHGCQGNYHSERKKEVGVWGGLMQGEEKKSPTAFMDRIRLWWNIIPARQTAAGLFSLSLALLPSLFMSSSLSQSLYHLSFHSPHLTLSACLSLSALFLLPLPLSMFSTSVFSLFSIPHAAESSEISL